MKNLLIATILGLALIVPAHFSAADNSSFTKEFLYQKQKKKNQKTKKKNLKNHLPKTKAVRITDIR